MSGPLGSSHFLYDTAEAAGQSLRFEDGDSAYLSWTPASAGNRKTWTWSGWVKRGNLGTAQYILGTPSADSFLAFVSTNTLYFRFDSSGPRELITSAVYRDTGAWYHILISSDTTQATSSDRMSMYVNGVKITDFSTSTYPTLNMEGSVNNTVQHNIGVSGAVTGPFDGYLANVCFIDGTALDPTSFGEYDDTLWVPKSDTAIENLTFGTNGFYLPFKQTTEAEGFSTVTYRGNGDTQAIEGVGFEPDLVWFKKRSSGTTRDHILYDTVRGVGNRLRANQTTSESSAYDELQSFDSNGFRVGSSDNENGSGNRYVAWCWDAGDNLASTGFTAINYVGDGIVGRSVGGVGFDPDLVWIKRRNSTASHNLYDTVRGAGLNLRPDISDAEDSSASGLLSFEKEGFTVGNSSLVNASGSEYVAWCWDAGTGSAVSNTDGTITSTVKADATKGFSVATYTGNLTSGATFGHGLGVTPEMVIVKRRDSTGVWTVYTSVTGATKYLELDSTDIATTATNRWNDTAPTSSVISLGNTNNVNGSGSTYVAYSFASVSGYSKIGSYTGTGSSGNSITGLGFRPAFIMVKSYDQTRNWTVWDSTRTPLNPADGHLHPSADVAEQTGSDEIQFDSDGFTFLSGDADSNSSGFNYIYMAFAGGQDLISPVNTDGSITSRVKANTANGFSITSYVGSGASATVGHGLTSAPEIIIVKNRDSGTNWPVYTTAIDSTYDFVYLNLTNAAGDASAIATPTSSVFSLGSSSTSNASGSDHIAYCFHSVSGYSKIGSYTGTGATGNSITGLGFKPAFVVVKRTSSTGSWVVRDNTRSPVNPADDRLFWNANNFAGSALDMDFDSDGFTINTTTSDENASGSTYIYMAFADTRDATFFGDTSGNSNNWEPNALNNTDVVPDSPVSNGNFAVLNPLTLYTSNTSLAEGNLKANAVSSGSGSNWGTVFSSITLPTTGKYYVEGRAFINTGSGNSSHLGVLDTSSFAPAHNNATYSYTTGEGFDGIYLTLFNNYAQPVSDGVLGTAEGSITGTSALVMLAVDIDNGKVWAGYDGTWLNSGDPAAGTNEIATRTFSDTDAIAVGTAYNGSNDQGMFANFGQDSSFAGNETPQGNTDDNGVGDFFYAPPSGFLALTTGNLPTTTITAPDDYFNTVLYSGNGTSQSITGVGFSPDFLWLKERSSTSHHQLFHDIDGGTPKFMQSSSTIAEVTDAQVVSSFDTDGFSVGNSGGSNQSGQTYVGWNWYTGATPSSNTDGTITSTVSANTDAGFSIVSYTGTGVQPETVGHGLGVTPNLIIVKDRDAATNWHVFHSGVMPYTTDGKFMRLNTTDALLTDGSANVWYAGDFTSTVFGVGTANGVSSRDYIAYCFAEVEGYSKIGSYTGNGSADGTFVHCGFRPAFLMVKRTDATNNWLMLNNKTPGYNKNSELYANLSNAETTASDRIDLLSNGFKSRINSTTNNGSGATYIFIAFAEAPFTRANAR